MIRLVLAVAVLIVLGVAFILVLANRAAIRAQVERRIRSRYGW